MTPMQFEIKSPLTVTYSVDKCNFACYNGEHTEEFDLSDLTSDDITQYIAQTLIIKRQGMLRGKTTCDENGDMKIALGSWRVTKPGKRISVDPVSKISDMMAKLSPEQRKAFLELALQAAE